MPAAVLLHDPGCVLPRALHVTSAGEPCSRNGCLQLWSHVACSARAVCSERTSTWMLVDIAVVLPFGGWESGRLARLDSWYIPQNPA